METIRGAQQTYNIAMEAEERQSLVKTLIRLGVGLPSIEHFHHKQNLQCKIGANRVRKESTILLHMKNKLKDATDHLKTVNRAKSQVKKRISKKLDEEEAGKLKEELKQSSEKQRERIQQKNKKKIDHLVKKFLPAKQALPESLVRYKAESLFVGEEDDEDCQEAPETPLIYGGLKLDEEESQALLLDPKLAVFDNLDEEKFETDMEMCAAKLRWNQIDKDEGEEIIVSDEEKERHEILDAKARLPFDAETLSFDYGKVKATDVKLNTELFLPKPQKVSYEVGLEMRRTKYLEVFRDFVKSNCDEKGRQKSNLSVKEKRGIKKLKSRMESNELIVCHTDKSGRLCVMPLKMYVECAEEHTNKDEEIDYKEAERTQQKLNGHVSMWLKILGMGSHWRHQERQRGTHLEQSVSVGPLYLLVKDHKPCQESGLPKTRPVCASNSGMNVHLSNILSDVLEKVADRMAGSAEVISTEDALSRLDRFNAMVQVEQEQSNVSRVSEGDVILENSTYCTDEEEFLSDSLLVESLLETQKEQPKQHDEVVIVGADVASLYPSLDPILTSELIYRAVLETEIEFQNIDYKEVSTYLAVVLNQSEARKMKIAHLLPVRRNRQGQKPKITGKSCLGPESCHDQHWVYPRSQYSDQEKKSLFARAIQIATRFLFTNHLYQFASKYFLQRSGAPIGVRLSCAAARVVMNMFDRELAEAMTRSGLVSQARFRYMDDLRELLGAIKCGWRYEQGGMLFRREWEEEERAEGLSRVEKTSRVLRQMMDSIFPSMLRFEMEHEEQFEGGRLPTLDFEMWKQGGLVMYSFYQKPVARKTVIQKRSALGESVKVASHSQNMFRRMSNTSELLPDSERIRIVNDFASQLLRSGYSRKQSQDIVVNGLRGYESLRLRAEKGEAKLHRPAEDGLEERTRKKILSKGNWFKQKKKNSHEHQGKKRRKKTVKSEQEPELVTVLFVPGTPGGQLANELKEVERNMAKVTGERVRVVERGGTTVKAMLVKSNPWILPCIRHEAGKDCLPCLHPKTETMDCSVKSVVYDIKCLDCGEDKAAVYCGHSSRSLGERGAEHLDNYRKGKVVSPLLKHHQLCHSEVVGEVAFRMEVVRRHPSSFSRQCHEIVRLERLSRQGNTELLNSKSEQYQRCSIPRLGFSQPLTAERHSEVRSQGMVASSDNVMVDRESNDRPGQSEQLGSDNVPGDGGGRDQNFLHHVSKKRRLNDDSGKDGSEELHRSKPRREDISLRKYFKPKYRRTDIKTNREV